jgi:uncharacterized membrane protein
MLDLTPLVGSFSEALGINDSGRVVGSEATRAGAFLYSGGTVEGLPGSAAFGIDDSGQVVGSDYEGDIVLLSPTTSTPIIGESVEEFDGGDQQ